MTKQRKCIECSENITQKQKLGIGCNCCDNAIHFSCLGKLPKTSKDPDFTVDEFRSGKKSWSCTQCRKKPASKNRRSSIFPANAASSVSPPPASTETQLQELIVAFNAYKKLTDDRIAHLEAVCEVKSQQIASLVSSIESVGEKAEKTARESAESSLEIQGIPENELQNPLVAILAIAGDIGCEISPEELTCEVSRSGSKPTVVIRFSSKHKRKTFLHAGKKFNRDRKRIRRDETDHKIFVNELLTADQKKLLYNTKAFARDADYRFSWFCNGEVHLKKTDASRLIIIKSQSQLETLSQNEASQLLPERERIENEDRPTSPSSEE
jgi:Baculovirus FP protein